MKKRFLTFLMYASMTLFVVGCGNNTTNQAPSAATQETHAATNLSGVWRSENNDGSYHEATITEDSIIINWVSDDGKTKSLYWSGTYTPTNEYVTEYSWVSENDHEQTDYALLASTDDTKEFLFKDNVLSYSASALGTTTTMELSKYSDDFPDTDDTVQLDATEPNAPISSDSETSPAASIFDTNDSSAAKYDFTNYPTVTYTDILSGEYNGQTVCLEGIVDNVSVREATVGLDFGGSSSFGSWLSYNGSYYYQWSNYISDVWDDSPVSAALNLKNGDVIRGIITIFDDGSFSFSNAEALEVIGTVNLDDIYSNYQNNCADLEYESLLRNPENYTTSTYKVSGTIIQVIDEDNYLLSTDGGNVYVYYVKNQENREYRFLENDNVTVCGCFNGLKTYDIVIGGQKTVPELSAYIISLN